ncbi:uncharacterized protein LOC142785289 [Rhipicephalus microplus]|uniref:uncharacterized protein LOC142785289 n=1 Tax=Rhipicephalus microplus TaxID=6941 RepID=UPI003F6B0108
MWPLLLPLLAVSMAASLPVLDGQDDDAREWHFKMSLTKVATKLREFVQGASRLSTDHHHMPSCGICSWAAGSVLKDIRRGLSKDVIADNLDHECKLFGLAGSERVCDGLISNFKRGPLLKETLVRMSSARRHRQLAVATRFAQEQ